MNTEQINKPVKKRVAKLIRGFESLSCGTEFALNRVLLNNFKPYLDAIESKLSSFVANNGERLSGPGKEYVGDGLLLVSGDLVEERVSQLISEFRSIPTSVLLDIFDLYLNVIEANLSAAEIAKEKAEEARDDFYQSILASDDTHQYQLDYADFF